MTYGLWPMARNVRLRSGEMKAIRPENLLEAPSDGAAKAKGNSMKDFEIL